MHDPSTLRKVRFTTTVPLHLKRTWILAYGMWVKRMHLPSGMAPPPPAFTTFHTLLHQCLATESALFQQLAFITLANPFYRENTEAQL